MDLLINPPPKALIFTGPAGAGTKQLIKRLISQYPNTLTTTVSHTTRSPRPGETDGVDYHFVTKSQFESMRDKGGFHEITFFCGRHYGTSRETLAKQRATGLTVILDVDMAGARKIKEYVIPDGRFVYVSPVTLKAFEAGLRAKGPEHVRDLQARLEGAKEDMFAAEVEIGFDLIVVNRDMELAFNKLCKFVFPEAGGSAAA